MSEQISLPASLDGERLDRALALVLERSRAEISALLDAGRVSIAGQVITRGHRRLREGELLDVDLSPLAEVQDDHVGEAIEFGICYVDDDIIVVDKPAGLVVHEGAGHRHDTLVDGLIASFPDLAELREEIDEEGPDRPGIVHRLDKDTSGLLVVARNATAFASLGAQMRARSVARQYISLVLGLVKADSGVIDAPIGRSGRDRTKMAISTSGRAARTSYQVRERYEEPLAASLLDLALETGRTHQIRVHLAAIGHPVAGDARYGGSARSLGLTRPFLHAAVLSLSHPRTGEQMTFSSALPADLASVLAGLSATR